MRTMCVKFSLTCIYCERGMIKSSCNKLSWNLYKFIIQLLKTTSWVTCTKSWWNTYFSRAIIIIFRISMWWKWNFYLLVGIQLIREVSLSLIIIKSSIECYSTNSITIKYLVWVLLDYSWNKITIRTKTWL